MDVCLNAFVVFWLVLHFFVENRPFTAAQTALVVCLGLISLIKFTLLLESTAILLMLIALDTGFRQRRFPWVVPGVPERPCWGFWLAAGQRLGSFGPFNWSCIRGRSPAASPRGWMLRSQRGESVGHRRFPGVRGGARRVGGLCRAGAQRPVLGKLLPAAGWGLLLFLMFKYGYVRHDGHEVTAAMELGLLLALVTLAVTSGPIDAGQRAGAGGGQPAAGNPDSPVRLPVTFSRYLDSGLPMNKFCRNLHLRVRVCSPRSG